MGLTLVSAATSYPVSIEEARDRCRMMGTRRDMELNGRIVGCTREVERWTGRGFVAQSWKLERTGFADAIELAVGPVTAITAFTYLDVDDVAQAVDPELYSLDLTGEPQWILRNPDASWPAVSDLANSVSVTFSVGYTPAAELDDVKDVLLDLIAARVDDPAVPLSRFHDRLRPHRRISI